MTDLRLKRDFALPTEELFRWISSPDALVQWWGPEGLHIPEGNLDFTRTGPWYSVMQNADGQRFKVSGHVTHVDPPRSVGFTWAWHDDADQRGEESHVTLTVESCAAGSRLIVDHRDLGDDERAADHETGWTSCLRKLAGLLN